LQVLVAESLASTFDLTIEAAPPTKPGKRRNGAVYVPEGQQPDLRVRQMGQPGADVALLSEKARALVHLPNREPIWWECKNTEGWALDASFWRSHDLPAVALKAIQQAYRASRENGTWMPVIVLGKNHHEPMVLWQDHHRDLGWIADDGAIVLAGPAWAMCRLDRFVCALWKTTGKEAVGASTAGLQGTTNRKAQGA